MRFIRWFVIFGFMGAMWAAPARTREVIRRGNVTVEVIAEGRGPLVVLLSSLGRDSDEFDPIAERIAAAGFRCCVRSHAGMGAAEVRWRT